MPIPAHCSPFDGRPPGWRYSFTSGDFSSPITHLNAISRFGTITCGESQNHPLVAYPPRHPLPVQILQQRDRVLARDPEEVFEAADVQLWGLRLLRRDLLL